MPLKLRVRNQDENLYGTLLELCVMRFPNRSTSDSDQSFSSYWTFSVDQTRHHHFVVIPRKWPRNDSIIASKDSVMKNSRNSTHMERGSLHLPCVGFRDSCFNTFFKSVREHVGSVSAIFCHARVQSFSKRFSCLPSGSTDTLHSCKRPANTPSVTVRATHLPDAIG